MHNKFKKVMILGLFISTLGLTGCNTIQGAGQDVENAGQSIERAAQ